MATTTAQLTAAQRQAVKALKAQFAPDALCIFATYDNETRRMISRATMDALVDKGVLKVKRVKSCSYDVRGRFGRGGVVATRSYSEAEYVWA